MKAKLWTLILISALSTIGCGKSVGSPANTAVASSVPYVQIPQGPYVPPSTGVGQNPGQDFAFGGTSPFTFKDTSTYNDYTQRYIPDVGLLSNVHINMNLVRTSSNAYGGTVTIRYNLNGQTYEGYFTSGNSPQATQYNVWFHSGSQKVWHGFFEDFMGAIVVVIDGVTDLGDGGGANGLVSGSVWYKNFGFTHAPHPPTYCWFVSIGPYDCQAWPNGSPNWDINTYAGIYPDSGYVKLGSFDSLDVNAAFNHQLAP